MTIEEQLLSFLQGRIRESENKHRNIEIILYYYGFRGSVWPTYEETANQFGLTTRERVRQLINKNFRKIADIKHLPGVYHCFEALSSRIYWTEKNLLSILYEESLIDEEYSIRGLFNLIEDFNLQLNYEIYTPDLKKVTRYTIQTYEEIFIIKTDKIEKIKSLFKKASAIPSSCGIANLDYLDEEFEEIEDEKNLIKDLIIHSKHSWKKEEDIAVPE